MSLKDNNIIRHMERGVRKVLKVSHLAEPLDPWSSRRRFKSRLHLKTRCIKTDGTKNKRQPNGPRRANYFLIFHSVSEWPHYEREQFLRWAQVNLSCPQIVSLNFGKFRKISVTNWQQVSLLKNI